MGGSRLRFLSLVSPKRKSLVRVQKRIIRTQYPDSFSMIIAHINLSSRQNIESLSPVNNLWLVIPFRDEKIESTASPIAFEAYFLDQSPPTLVYFSKIGNCIQSQYQDLCWLRLTFSWGKLVKDKGYKSIILFAST